MTSGIYVIEAQHGVVKVGMSTDTDTRINTHMRNARSVGQDPYRHAVFECPSELLRQAERRAHAAVRRMGGVPSARAREVFTSVYYNPVRDVVELEVGRYLHYVEAVSRLRELDAIDLDVLCDNVPMDVAVILREMALELEAE